MTTYTLHPNTVDRVGLRYGRLVVITFERGKGGRVGWRCQCDCGSIVVVVGSQLGVKTKSCGCLSRERRPVIERFNEKWSLDPGSGCWMWTGGVHKNGYGRFALESRVIEWAHRAAWLLLRGPIPEGLYVCHHCDVPLCVNPDHLFVGTATDNMRDAARKGRVVVPAETYRSDGSHQVAVLTDEQVREIRSSSETTAALHRSGRYLVGYMAIWAARRGRTFRDVR